MKLNLERRVPCASAGYNCAADYQRQVRSITQHERLLLNLFLFRQNLHNEGAKKQVIARVDASASPSFGERLVFVRCMLAHDEYLTGHSFQYHYCRIDR